MRDSKTYLYHYLITSVWYHGKLRMLRKVITLGTHVLWDTGQEGKGMGEGKMKGARGKSIVLMRSTGEQVRGGLCVRGTEEGWSVWSTVWRSTTEWDSRGTPGRTGKGEGSRLSFYLFVADDFIEKWFPTFPCFTYHSLDDTGMPTFEITLDTWGKRPLNFLSWAVYSASSHLSFLGNSKNGCKMQKKKNTISVLEKHFSRSDISYPVKRKSSLTSWIYTG